MDGRQFFRSKMHWLAVVFPPQGRVVRWLQLSLAVVVIIAVALLLHRTLLFPPNPDAVTPWSSDGWGHLMKAEYLLEQINQVPVTVQIYYLDQI